MHVLSAESSVGPNALVCPGLIFEEDILIFF